MEFFLTIVVFILIIGLLVFVHEGGHFLAAKLMKVTVYEFAIGFGPRIFEKNYKGTLYKVNLLPIGGYVSLEGEQESNNPNGFRNKGFLPKLFILSGGVIMNFLLAALLLFFFLGSNHFTFVLPKLANHNFITTKEDSSEVPFVVTGVVENQDYWKGLTSDDIILTINGERFSSISELYEFVSNNAGKEVKIETLDLKNLERSTVSTKTPEKVGDYRFPIIIEEVIEGGRTADIFTVGDEILAINNKTFSLPSDFPQILSEVQKTEATFTIKDKETNQIIQKTFQVPERNAEGATLDIRYKTFLGIGFSYFSDLGDNEVFLLKYRNSPISSLGLSYDLSVYQYKVLGNLLGDAFNSGDFSEVSKSVGGPIAVGDAVGTVVNYGDLSSIIFLTALISLSLAAFNILPIPALDGGQIAIAAVESIRRKKFSDETVNRINFGGFAFLMLLSVLILFKDVAQFKIIDNILEIFRKVLGK